ncbi:MAG: hypothetical protein V1845_01490 [bacterium]
MYGQGIGDVIFMMILFGSAMMLINLEVGDPDSSLGAYGMMLVSFAFLLLAICIFPPDNAPTWEDVRPWFVAHYRGW